MRKVPVAARWCALIAFANALVWSVITPPFQVPDETVHVSYLQYLAETGEIPNEPGGAVFSSDQVGVLEGLAFSAVVRSPRERALFTSYQDRGLDRVAASGRDRVSGGGTAESSSQPPLFYAYESIGYLVSPWQSLLDRLWLMRLMSALLCAATVVFVYMFLRELFSAPWIWTVGALAVAFQPVFAFIGSGVNPDSLFFAASAALFWALARAFKRGLTVPRGIGIGAALAVGALGKLNFLALVPGALLGVALLVWRERRSPERRDALGGAALAVGILALASVVYIGLNELVWDRSAWGGGVGVAANSARGVTTSEDPIGITDQLSYTWQLFLPRLPFMEDQFSYYPLGATWFRGLIGRFGWLDTSFDRWVYWVAFGVVVPLLILLAVAIVRNRHLLRSRPAELLTYAAIVAGLVFAIGVSGLRYVRDTGFAFEQARYLLPLLPLYGAAVVGAALGAGTRFAKPIGAALVALAAVHGLFAQLLVISRFYG